MVGETGVDVWLTGSYEYLNSGRLANSAAVAGAAPRSAMRIKNPHKKVRFKAGERFRNIVLALEKSVHNLSHSSNVLLARCECR